MVRLYRAQAARETKIRNKNTCRQVGAHGVNAWL